ncbi:major facilitator superfamily domain-containing protein [Dipodascopsis tothii]|uniref:major facilitator superfamily domain-containing protein n=1 Tax=Dipodascopsis tothii TaxID=44089 RepID=UPI0034CDCB22
MVTTSFLAGAVRMEDDEIKRPTDAHMTRIRPFTDVSAAASASATPMIELTEFMKGMPLGSPGAESFNASYMPSGYSTPGGALLGGVAPVDGAASPPELAEPEMVPKLSLNEPRKNYWRLISSSLVVFSIGLNDGAPGALLPYMESYYGISYAIVSLIWLGNTLGFITVAAFSHNIYCNLGRASMISIGALFIIGMYFLVIFAPPFPAIIAGFYLGGIGLAMMLAQINVFLSYLKNSEVMFGIVHGSYGVGATISPIIATLMVSGGVRWSLYYLIPLGMYVVNVVFLSWSYMGSDRDLGMQEQVRDNRFRRQIADRLNRSMPGTTVPSPNQRVSSDEESDSGIREAAAAAVAALSEQQKQAQIDDSKLAYREVLRDRTSWLTAFFIFFYQGCEVSIGGWIVSFMIDSRGGSPAAVGYVASGFWGGVTVGRFVLNQVIPRVTTAQRAVFFLLSAVASFELMTWLIPNVIGGAVAVSLAGVFIGPIYPCVMTTTSVLLPRRIQAISLTIITAFGSCGGALWPFVIGLLAQAKGTWVLHPMAVALVGAMLTCWFFVPSPPSKKE